MNEIVNKFLLAGNKFMPEMYLKQPGFTHSACRPLQIYKNELEKSCFQQNMAYGDFKNLKRRTFFDKGLRDKEFNIAKKPKYDGYQRGLACMAYKCFDEKSTGRGIANNEIKQNLQLAEEINKPIIR